MVHGATCTFNFVEVCTPKANTVVNCRTAHIKQPPTLYCQKVGLIALVEAPTIAHAYN